MATVTQGHILRRLLQQLRQLLLLHARECGEGIMLGSYGGGEALQTPHPAVWEVANAKLVPYREAMSVKYNTKH